MNLDLQTIRLGLDRTFDALGYMPVVSTYSGIARMVYGLALAIGALAYQIFATIWEDVRRRMELSSLPSLANSHIVSTFGLGYGCVNVIRGFVEAQVYLGNLAVIAYDCISDSIFQGRMLFNVPTMSTDNWMNRPLVNYDNVKRGFQFAAESVCWIGMKAGVVLGYVEKGLAPPSHPHEDKPISQDGLK